MLGLKLINASYIEWLDIVGRRTHAAEIVDCSVLGAVPGRRDGSRQRRCPALPDEGRRTAPHPDGGRGYRSQREDAEAQGAQRPRRQTGRISPVRWKTGARRPGTGKHALYHRSSPSGRRAFPGRHQALLLYSDGRSLQALRERVLGDHGETTLGLSV